MVFHPNGWLSRARGAVYYCDGHTDLLMTGNGQGSDVVIGLLENSSVNEGCRVAHLRLTISSCHCRCWINLQKFRLVLHVGTIRDNGFQKAPDGTNMLVRWNDNKVVTVALWTTANHSEMREMQRPSAFGMQSPSSFQITFCEPL